MRGPGRQSHRSSTDYKHFFLSTPGGKKPDIADRSMSVFHIPPFHNPGKPVGRRSQLELSSTAAFDGSESGAGC